MATGAVILAVGVASLLWVARHGRRTTDDGRRTTGERDEGRRATAMRELEW
jgi:membrane protein implicated in regulation of membrane protease activity